MDFTFFTDLFRERTKPVVAAGLAGGALALFLLITGSYRFKASSDFLIIQSSVPYRELYSLSKSAEYISNVLIDAAQSELFINEAARNASLALPSERIERLERWRDIVSIKKNFRSNVLTVEVKADDQSEVIRLAHAVAYVLTEKNHLFRTGSVEGVTVRMLSGPIVEENLSLGMLLAVTAVGALAGATLVLAYARMRSGAFSLFTSRGKGDALSDNHPGVEISGFSA